MNSDYVLNAQAKQNINYNEKNNCIKFNSITRQVFISCLDKPVFLTDIYKKMHNPNVLNKDSLFQKIWILNASLVVNKGSILDIDSNDTLWLKILTNQKINPYGIFIHGSLKIDKAKITSWDIKTNSFVKYNDTIGRKKLIASRCVSHCENLKKNYTSGFIPRPFISVSENSTGTSNITNSEIAYLGYNGGHGIKTSGLYYASGEGSLIKNNKIHNLYFGFYASSGLGNLTIENNLFYDNVHYGIYSHMGSHDTLIRNNSIYDNNDDALVCSLNCYKVIYTNNTIYENNGSGIVLNKNTTQSSIKFNLIHNQLKPIILDDSNNNDIFGNKILNSKSNGISLVGNSSGNKIHDNVIQNTTTGISFKNDKNKNSIHGNSVYSNQILSTKRKSIDANHDVMGTNVIDKIDKKN
ncbi:MAG TPA: right-handed parallel beta-helix repeat-containing protein [Candidatus Nitrosocosmicus sp.]